MNLVNNDKMTKVVSVILAVVFGVLVISLVANAVTTISGTSITLENGEIISNGTDGTIKLGIAGNVVQILGTASTSALKVGDEAVSTINGIVTGYCVVAAVDVSAATTTYADCASATGLLTGDKVFVQATGTLPIATVVTAASTTGADTIQLRFHAMAGATTIAANTVTLWFWGVR